MAWWRRFGFHRVLVSGMTLALLGSVAASAFAGDGGPSPIPPPNTYILQKNLGTAAPVSPGNVVFGVTIGVGTGRQGLVLTDTITNAGNDVEFPPSANGPWTSVSNPSNQRVVATMAIGDQHPFFLQFLMTVRFPRDLGCYRQVTNNATLTDNAGFLATDSISFTVRGCGAHADVTPGEDQAPAFLGRFITPE